MRKLISILVLLCLVAGAFTVMPLTVGAAGSDFVITSVLDWNTFAASASDYSNVIVNVTGGVLDFDGTSPTKASGFTGTFDGNGVVFTNVAMSGTGDDGLFCSFDGATIKNIVITNSTFTSSGEYVGAVACCGKGESTIENVYVDKTVTVTSTKTSGNAYAAGIVGNYYEKSDATLTVKDCVVAGNIVGNGAQYCGGFIGNSSGNSGSNKVILTNCLMLGKVTNTKKDSSGIIGNGGKTALTMNNCIYAGSGFYSYPYGKAKTITANNCYTTTYEVDGFTYNGGSDSNEGITKIDSINDIVGSDAITVSGYTKRNGDVIVPTGVAEFNLPAFVSMETVTYENWDGEVLQSSLWNTGEMPEYTGETPTKPDTELCAYVFAGWTPTVVAVNGAATYTATFTEVLKAEAPEEVDGKYYINNVDQYLYFMKNASDYDGETVALGDDIDFEGTEDILKPITGFAGTFDGQGHTIKNVTMTGNSDVALFCGLGDNATVTNLVIKSSTFKIDGEGNWLGTVGCCTDGKNVTISNIYVDKDVAVVSETSHDNSIAGGILGGVYGGGAVVTVTDCVFAGTVTATGKYVAGIVGNAESGNTTLVKNCLNAGDIKSNGSYVAGIAVSGGITVENCVNVGKVTGSNYVGGIYAGNPTDSVAITNCYTVGNVAEAHNTVNGGVVTLENGASDIGIASLLGVNVAISIEGWTAREDDVIVPDGVADFAPTWYSEELTCTVIWMNGTVQLEVDQCKLGDIPTYDGETPTKADYKNFSYRFAGWSPEVGPVSGDVTYVAVFDMIENEITEDSDTDTETDSETDIVDGTDTEEDTESDVESEPDSETESDPYSETEPETEQGEVEEKSFFGKIFDAIFNFFKGIIDWIFGKKD